MGALFQENSKICLTKLLFCTGRLGKLWRWWRVNLEVDGFCTSCVRWLTITFSLLLNESEKRYQNRCCIKCLENSWTTICFCIMLVHFTLPSRLGHRTFTNTVVPCNSTIVQMAIVCMIMFSRTRTMLNALDLIFKILFCNKPICLLTV